MISRLLFLCVAATFALVVLANPLNAIVERQTAAKDAYGFVYFTGEDLPNGEQIYFAVSKGNSPVSWNLVNDGKPVLTSTLGEKAVRDPYIIRDPATNKVFIIATDLKMYGRNGQWGPVERRGSLSLAIWESSDLKTWSPQRLVKVAPSTAGMAWAPEVTYVDGKFVVYWASNLFAASDTAHTGNTYSRILYATTTDFRSFTPAAVWIDKGENLIDTSVVWDKATSSYHRFSAYGGWIYQETAKSFFGTWTTVNPKIGGETPLRLEGPLIFESNRYPGVWHLFADGLDPHGYVPYETSNITGGVWTRSTGYALPPNPRHGTVIAITSAEAANLASISP